MRITMLVVSPHNQATPTLPRTMGWWDFWWTALSQQWSWAALPQQWSSRASSSGSRLTPTLPSWTMPRAAGISDGPHCHNNGLGPHGHTNGFDCPPFHLVGPFATLLPSGPYHFVSIFRVWGRRKLRTEYFTLVCGDLFPHPHTLCRNLRRTRNEFTNSSALTSNVHEQRRNINKNKMAAAFRTKMAAVSPLSIFSQYK